ncbi:MAG: hypothetical protein ACPGLV_03550, partial [Bacteroidia bacterium]
MSLFFFRSSINAQVGVKFFKDYYACSYGVIDTVSGDTLQTPQFTDYRLVGNHYVVNQNGAYGILSAKTGKLLIDCKYNALKTRWRNFNYRKPSPYGNWYLFYNGKWWGLLHTKKGEVIPASLADPHANLLSKRSNKRQNCYFDTLGAVMCFEAYDDVFHGADYFTLIRNEHVFVANRKGELLVNDSFNTADVLANNHFYFEKDSLKGFYNSSGRLFYATTKSIESLNFRKELISYNSSKIIIVDGNNWGYLNMEGEILEWILEPVFDTIMVTKYAGDYNYKRNLCKAIDNAGKYWLIDENEQKIQVKNADKLDLKVWIEDNGSAKSVVYEVFYFKHKGLYKYSSLSKKHIQIASANDFELHNGHLFVKMRKKWFYYNENELTPLKASEFYFLSSEKVFLYRNRGIQTFNADKVQFNKEYYNEIFCGKNGVDAIDENGGLARFEGSSALKLENRCQIIEQDVGGVVKLGLFDTLKRGLLFYPEFDTIIIARDKLAYLTRGEEQSIYNVAKQQFITEPGKYPIVELKPNKGWYRYGYDSSSCIHLFDGTQIAKWQKIIYFEDFDDKSYFAATDTNAMGLLNRANPSKWLVKSKYCAISAYDAKTKRASVRACPIERFYQSGYWDEPVDPQNGQWGVVDSTGEWLVAPKSIFPINLKNENQFIKTYSGYELINLKGDVLWDKRYQFIDTFTAQQGAYWVGDNLKNRGLRKLNGDFLIKDEYNWIKEVNDTIYALKWPVEKPEKGTSYPEDHADGKNAISKLQVFYFDKKWKPIELSGLARVNFIKDHVNLEWEPQLDLNGVKGKKYTPICEWAVDEYLNSNSVIEDNWNNNNYWASLSFGTTLPIYRMPQNVFYRSPRYIDFEYQNMTVNGTNYGAYVETEYLGGTIGPGAQQYTSMEFKNVIFENGEIKELELWKVVDKKCLYALNDSLVKRLKKLELDIDCGKDGLVIYPLMEHFIVTNDSLTFLIQNETEYYETTFDSISIK